MNGSNDSGTIKIGGIDREYEILYDDIDMYRRRWNSQYWACKKNFEKTHGFEFNPTDKTHAMVIPSEFYLWVIWKALIKKKGRFGRVKDPFKSIKEMRSRIRRDEFQELMDLAGRDILKLRMSEEGREPGNESPQQSQSSLQQ